MFRRLGLCRIGTSSVRQARNLIACSSLPHSRRPQADVLESRLQIRPVEALFQPRAKNRKRWERLLLRLRSQRIHKLPCGFGMACVNQIQHRAPHRRADAIRITSVYHLARRSQLFVPLHRLRRWLLHLVEREMVCAARFASWAKRSVTLPTANRQSMWASTRTSSQPLRSSSSRSLPRSKYAPSSSASFKRGQQSELRLQFKYVVLGAAMRAAAEDGNNHVRTAEPGDVGPVFDRWSICRRIARLAQRCALGPTENLAVNEFAVARSPSGKCRRRANMS